MESISNILWGVRQKSLLLPNGEIKLCLISGYYKKVVTPHKMGQDGEIKLCLISGYYKKVVTPHKMGQDGGSQKTSREPPRSAKEVKGGRW